MAQGSLYGAFAINDLFAELGDPHDYGSGVVSAATQRQTALRNLINSTTFTVAQLAALDNVVPGTAAASKALVLSAGGGIATITSATITTLTTSTISGGPAFTTMPSVPRATVAATGTNLATAAAVVAGFTSVTAADGTKGVTLPATPVAGTVVYIKNTAASILKIWPDAAATINAIAANASLNIAASTSVTLIADSPTQWYSFPLLPS